MPLQFVVLSRSDVGCSPDTFDEQVFGDRCYGCMLNVMAVKSVDIMVDGMEVFERVGVGMIAEAAWIAAGFGFLNGWYGWSEKVSRRCHIAAPTTIEYVTIIL